MDIQKPIKIKGPKYGRCRSAKSFNLNFKKTHEKSIRKTSKFNRKTTTGIHKIKYASKP